MAQSLPTVVPPNRLLEHVDDFARHDPAKAVATAFGFGFLLHVLPLGAIVSMLVSVLFTVARPVLLLLGVLKAFDLARAKSSANSGSTCE